MTSGPQQDQLARRATIRQEFQPNSRPLQRGHRVFTWWLIGTGLGGTAAIAAEAAPPTVLTNLIQLSAMVEARNGIERLQWQADLAASVQIGGRGLALVTFDPSDQIAVIDASRTEKPLERGQRLRFQGFWLTGPGSERPDRWATVNNDGTHSRAEARGTAVLTAGRHPIRLLYFNRGGVADLEVFWTGPHFARQPIPSNVLRPDSSASIATSHGLAFKYYEGEWPALASLPHDDFSSVPALTNGVVANFDLGVARTASNFGLEFTGSIEVPETGRYEFTTSSDDGSLLIVGDIAPRITALGTTEVPPLPHWTAGQAWSGSGATACAAVSGIAGFAHTTADGLDLELTSANGRTLVHILNSRTLTPQLLNGSRITVAGLAQRARTPEGLAIIGQLLCVSEDAVLIENLPNRTWSALPQNSISALPPPATNAAVARRVTGTLRRPAESGPWLLSDVTGELPVDLRGLIAAMPNQTCELLLVAPARPDGAWPAIAVREQTRGVAPAAASLPVLSSIDEIKKLTRAEAQQGYPVKVRGVVTFIWPDNGFFLQDASWSVDVRATNLNSTPRIGEFWEVEGETFAEFAPNIRARAARRLGEGVMPQPVPATLAQLMDGSLDTLYIEVQGVVSAVNEDRLILLTREGRVRIQLPNLPRRVLEESLNALVHIRGCVVPGRELFTQQVRIGDFGLLNAQLSVEGPPPENVFDVAAKSVPDLLLFDSQAHPLQRTKIIGQVLHQRDAEVFLIDGEHGARFIPKTPLTLRPGDLVEVVGFPDLNGPTPLLRDAWVRLTNHTVLPAPLALSADTLMSSRHDSTLVTLEARLLAQRTGQFDSVLELQHGARTFLARLAKSAGALPEFRPDSQLRITGVYVGLGGDRVAAREIDGFEVLLNSPQDVRVEHLPSWWTARHALGALGLLGGVLLLALAWIYALRRRVAQRTLALTDEIEDHKRTESQLELKTHMLEREIEERKRMELEIEKSHKQLLATSRLAGMAEVATSVLHNVGNVMTSVNVLSSSIVNQVHRSKAPNLTKLGDLLQQHHEELGRFVTEDQRGQLLPKYVSDLGSHLTQEQRWLLEKVSALKENIHHINEIVALQQDYASATGLLENVVPIEIVEDALRMHGESLARHGIALVRQFQSLPPVTIDRHKTLQILFNLLENAKHACLQTNLPDREVAISVAPLDGGQFEIVVADNGVGILAENLARVFGQGFSTRRDGHGFGLHSSILMAQDMGGTLTAQSAGPGCGATFTLRLPVAPPRPNPRPAAAAGGGKAE